MKKWLLFWANALFILAGLKAQNIQLSISKLNNDTKINIENYLQIKTLDTKNAKFTALSQTPKPNANQTYLVRLKVKNETNYPTEFFVDFGRIAYGKFYYVIDNQIVMNRKFGELYSLSVKEEPEYSQGKVRIGLPAYFEDWVFFELQGIQNLKVEAFSVRFYDQIIKKRNWTQALFHGAIWVLIFYNFILFFGTKDRTYLYYSMYMLTASGYYFFSYGLVAEVFFPENPAYSIYFWVLTISSAVFFVLFMRRFTNTAELMPRWDAILGYHPHLKGLIMIVLWIGIFFEIPTHIRSNISISATLLEAILIAITLVLLARTKNKLAYFFVGATSILIVFMVLNQFGYFLFPSLANYFGQFGIIAEVILFSVGLSYRIKKIEKAKQKAQNQVIEQLEKIKKMQETANAELEKCVKIRTAELQEANEELNQINEELNVTLETVNEQNVTIQEKNSNITAGINYAKRIQEAVLPSQQKIKSVFSESFIFFKPRDIVSGDFYYFSEKPDKVFILGADCTGHGVPGAFMSLIGNAFFDQVIHIHKITTPDLILEYMRNSIRTTLRQDQTGSRDGMEVGVCILHGNKNQGFTRLEFAGAGHPLYYFDNQQDEVQVFRGNRIFIGGVIEQHNHFQKHQTAVHQGFTFYLFSDGYADQFGGEEGRKFMKKRFRELLAQIQPKSMTEQQQILEYQHQKWKGNQHEQVDDILVIGIRI